jgi:hypothetical protein
MRAIPLRPKKISLAYRILADGFCCFSITPRALPWANIYWPFRLGLKEELVHFT